MVPTNMKRKEEYYKQHFAINLNEKYLNEKNEKYNSLKRLTSDEMVNQGSPMPT